MQFLTWVAFSFEQDKEAPKEDSKAAEPPKRKRRWGSTQTAEKKPSFSISTDSLKVAMGF
jgi:hypothetical protein